MTAGAQPVPREGGPWALRPHRWQLWGTLRVFLACEIHPQSRPSPQLTLVMRRLQNESDRPGFGAAQLGSWLLADTAPLCVCQLCPWGQWFLRWQRGLEARVCQGLAHSGRPLTKCVLLDSGARVQESPGHARSPAALPASRRAEGCPRATCPARGLHTHSCCAPDHIWARGGGRY